MLPEIFFKFSMSWKDMLYLKAFHIIGVVVWFSGLFYLGRLFIYHQEAQSRPEAEKQILTEQFALMEQRLWWAIAWPGMALTLAMGLGLLFFWGLPGWLYAKLALVFVLVAYHMLCGRVRKQLKENRCRWSSKQLRLFNEVPSLLLVATVFVVVFKNQLSWDWLLLALLGLILVIGGTVQWVARKRKIPPSP